MEIFISVPIKRTVKFSTVVTILKIVFNFIKFSYRKQYTYFGIYFLTIFVTIIDTKIGGKVWWLY